MHEKSQSRDWESDVHAVKFFFSIQQSSTPFTRHGITTVVFVTNFGSFGCQFSMMWRINAQERINSRDFNKKDVEKEVELPCPKTEMEKEANCLVKSLSSGLNGFGAKMLRFNPHANYILKLIKVCHSCSLLWFVIGPIVNDWFCTKTVIFNVFQEPNPMARYISVVSFYGRCCISCR